MKTQIFIKLSMTSNVIQGRIRPHLCKNLSSTFVYGSILIKSLIFIKLYMTWFTLRHFDLITTLNSGLGTIFVLIFTTYHNEEIWTIQLQFAGYLMFIQRMTGKDLPSLYISIYIVAVRQRKWNSLWNVRWILHFLWY